MTTNQCRQIVAVQMRGVEKKARLAVAAVVGGFLIALSGCGTPPIVGSWEGKWEGDDIVRSLTFFLDGTGKAYAPWGGKPFTWKQVGNKYEITRENDSEEKLTGLLRENGTLEVRFLSDPDRGLLLMKKVNAN